MKFRIHFIAIACIVFSCKAPSDKYYIGKDADLFGTKKSYILGEKRNDSLQLWYVSYDINAGYYIPTETEVFPFRPGQGKRFIIKSIKGNSIIGNEMNLYRVSDIHNYFRLRNEVVVNELDAEFNDSVKNILQVHTNMFFENRLGDREARTKLVSQTHCDSFPAVFRHFLQLQLSAVYAEHAAKKLRYSELVNGKISLDSIAFRQFSNDYDHGFYDRKMLYHFITQKPGLFFLQINLSHIESEVQYCPACFTKEELDEMYCKLKPFRQKDPHKLWMFERHGDLKCQSE